MSLYLWSFTQLGSLQPRAIRSTDFVVLLGPLSDWGVYSIFFLDWVHNTEVGALLLRCLEGGQSDVTSGVFIGDDILGLMGRR